MTVARTCVGCGNRGEKRAMYRLVRAEARIDVDLAQRRHGRGAYLHPRLECLGAFAKRRGGLRSLRWTPPVGERTRVAEALAAGAPGVR